MNFETSTFLQLNPFQTVIYKMMSILLRSYCDDDTKPKQSEQIDQGLYGFHNHYDDVIMGAMASQITSLTIVYSTVYSGADQSKHQSYSNQSIITL